MAHPRAAISTMRKLGAAGGCALEGQHCWAACALIRARMAHAWVRRAPHAAPVLLLGACGPARQAPRHSRLKYMVNWLLMSWLPCSASPSEARARSGFLLKCALQKGRL